MIKTITVSGITAVDFDPNNTQPYFYAANKYIWIRNDSEDAIYASLNSSCTAGADGTMKIPAGEAGMLILSPDNTIYLSGSGAAEIRTGDTAECPFKTAAKGGDSSTAVKYTEQTLTDAQKTQARTNIGAGTSSFSGSYGDLTNAPPLVKGGGYGGNMIGGTGVNTNTTRYANSVAYGNSAVATANYAFAFGDNATAGNYNRSTGKHAVAIGNNVRAEKDYEFAYGKFNQSNADTAFSFGDGTSENDRHNLMELKTDGRLFLNGYAVIVPEVVTGYDATKTQVLKNVNGTLTWVDDT